MFVVFLLLTLTPTRSTRTAPLFPFTTLFRSEVTLFGSRCLIYSSFKLWRLYAKRSRGTIVVDAGAARALRDDGTSLLPVGVVSVEGEFEPGDAVEVAYDGGDRKSTRLNSSH